jgi:hypothetical protein
MGEAEAENSRKTSARGWLPDIMPGDVAVMDNLPAHKVPSVRQAIEAAGAILTVSSRSNGLRLRHRRRAETGPGEARPARAERKEHRQHEQRPRDTQGAASTRDQRDPRGCRRGAQRELAADAMKAALAVLDGRSRVAALDFRKWRKAAAPAMRRFVGSWMKSRRTDDASFRLGMTQKFAVASKARNPTSDFVTAPTSSPSECSVWRGDPGSLKA